MNLIKKPSGNHYAGRYGWKPDVIVFHQTGNTSAADSLRWYTNPDSGVCPHFVIDTNGDIYQLVELDNGAWANGTNTTPGDRLYYGFALSNIVKSRKTNANYYTYSIEFVHCRWGDINEKQVTAAVELIKNVIIPHMKKSGVTPQIDRDHLIGHSHVTPKTRDPEKYNCPGKQFPYDEIISRVNGVASPSEPGIEVGDKVTLLPTADTYAGSTLAIPARFKGKTFTVDKILPGKVRLKELFSWVQDSDVKKI